MTTSNSTPLMIEADAYLERLSYAFCQTDEGRRTLIDAARNEAVTWLRQRNDHALLRRHLFNVMHGSYVKIVLAGATMSGTLGNSSGEMRRKKKPA